MARSQKFGGHGKMAKKGGAHPKGAMGKGQKVQAHTMGAVPKNPRGTLSS
jgi:hypothetical protein